MTVNGMPDTYYGCYMYNDGIFPYLIKRTLDFLVLNSEEDGLMARILDVCIEPGMRFNYKGPGRYGYKIEGKLTQKQLREKFPYKSVKELYEEQSEYINNEDIITSKILYEKLKLINNL